MGDRCQLSADCIFLNEEEQPIGIGLCFNQTCFCNKRYGWSGKFCSDSTSQLLYIQVNTILFVLAYFGLVPWIAFHFIKALRLKTPKSKLSSSVGRMQSATELHNNILVILLLTLTGVILIAIGNINRLFSSFDATYFDHIENLGLDRFESDDGLFLYPSNEEAFHIFQIIGLNFLTFASFILISVLVNILKQVMVFSKLESKIQQLITYNNITKILVLISFILTVILLLTRQLLLLLMTVALISFILFILTSVGYFFLTVLFEEFDVHKAAIREISRVAKYQLIAYSMRTILTGLLLIFFIFLDAARLSGDFLLFFVTSIYYIFGYLNALIAVSNVLYCRNAYSALEKISDKRANSASILASTIGNK